MASELSFYDVFYALQWSGLDLGSETVKVILVKSDYTFDAQHETYAEVLASGTLLEVANGSGYATGGETIGSAAVTVETGPLTVFSGDDVTWTALTATFRYAIYYIDGTVGGYTDPVLCCVLLDDTPADIVCSAVDYQLIHSESGIFTIGLAQ
jgi:hypothetical protein